MQHTRALVVILGLLAGGTAAAAPAEQPKTLVQIGGDAVTVDGRASLSTDDLFEVGTAAFKPAAKSLIVDLALTLKQADAMIRVDCYTDDVAPDGDRTGAWLTALSTARAEAFRAALVKRGVPAKRLLASGQGPTHPLADAQASRRIELVVIREVRPPVAADLATYTKRFRGKGPLTATLETTSGTLHCELFEAQTPMTVANFVGLATGQKAWKDPDTSATVRNRPFYDGLIFHRVIPDFMIQGGDPRGVGTGGPGYTFDDEIVPELTHRPGALAMANAGPSTNGSQFFIDLGDNRWLDGKHTIFGQCKELDVVKAIGAVPRGANDRPNTAVVIKRVRISR
ncbi:MAG: peptidylprolyl isomerase [Deltaproteobacteria bacterium]|nr:peptidylprolyl isomerase [Deltaproteobacteria bacterium]